jgi:hypothetical protein
MKSDVCVIESPSHIYTPEKYLIKLYSFETDTFTIVSKFTTKENYQEHFNSLVAVLGDFDVTIEDFTYTLSKKVKVVKKGYLFNTVTDKVLNIYSLSLLKVDTTLSQLWNDTVETEETETKSTQTEVNEEDTYSSPKLYTNQEWMNYDWTYSPANDPFPDVPYQQLVPLIEPRLVRPLDKNVKENCQGYGDNPFVFDWSKPQKKPVKKMKHVFHDLSIVNEEVKLKLALPNFGLKYSDTKFKLH